MFMHIELGSILVAQLLFIHSLLTLVNCLKIDIGFFLKTLLAKYCKNFDGVRISPAINLSGVPSFFGYQKIGRAAICHIFPAKDDLSISTAISFISVTLKIMSV